MKRIISLFLILALAIPLLSACAKPSETASSGSGILPDSGGGKERAERIDEGKYLYFIYSTDDGDKWIRDRIGNVECTEGYFYRFADNNVELVLDMYLTDLAPLTYDNPADSFFAVTKGGSLITFPNAEKVQGDEIRTLYRRKNSKISSPCVNDGEVYFIEGDDIKRLTDGNYSDGMSTDFGLAETLFTCKNAISIDFDSDRKELMICSTNNRFYVYDIVKKEFVFIGREFEDADFKDGNTNPVIALQSFLYGYEG